jgi:hypothetical protein
VSVSAAALVRWAVAVMFGDDVRFELARPRSPGASALALAVGARTPCAMRLPWIESGALPRGGFLSLGCS